MFGGFSAEQNGHAQFLFHELTVSKDQRAACFEEDPHR